MTNAFGDLSVVELALLRPLLNPYRQHWGAWIGAVSNDYAIRISASPIEEVVRVADIMFHRRLLIEVGQDDISKRAETFQEGGLVTPYWTAYKTVVVPLLAVDISESGISVLESLTSRVNHWPLGEFDFYRVSSEHYASGSNGVRKVSYSTTSLDLANKRFTGLELERNGIVFSRRFIKDHWWRKPVLGYSAEWFV